MKIAKTIKSVRKLVKAARSRGKKIGFVPTMGALHIGHISLIEAAVKKCDFVVVSIFVNPTQFAPTEDFDKYPRPLDADLKICRKAGVDVVFAPATKQMYGSENLTWVNVEKLAEPLCGRSGRASSEAWPRSALSCLTSLPPISRSLARRMPSRQSLLDEWLPI